MNSRESVLLKNADRPGPAGIDEYGEWGGYRSLHKALSMEPGQVLDEVKKSGLRGRGGAGFPTGMKWSFAVADPQTQKYLLCNADEGEPGTFKDRIIIEKNPHLLIEGMVISAYAVGAASGYIYLRGEYPKAKDILLRAIKEAYEKNYLGDSILGKGVVFHLHIHCGAGAYICGEETALIESLEGKRGQPRIKPPFPVNEGFSSKPTVVNNVETLANIPYILEIGGDEYAKIGSPECPGLKLFSVSGHVKRPGVYELPMGVTLREIIYTHCGGIRGDRKLKGVIPGGVSTPVLLPDTIDCPMDFFHLGKVGSMLGSGAVIVFDETVDMVKVCLRITKFFEHESCGKCTPCREGVSWLRAVLERMSNGSGRGGDKDLLTEVSNNIAGKTFCPLGENAAAAVQSFVNNFGDEFKEKIKSG
ncbi:MAG: NADH-quinone oxidoreductase subunit NuoF [Nitrospirae bacterium]|nr:NADH-quinone oxidoreductase subunit NuoF [Nitrospirota bacterium]